VFRHYLRASMGSAVVMSIYAFVDAIAVGQAEGPNGAAAMAVISPMYGVIVFLALMCGIGGGVMMGNSRGEGNWEEGDRWFSAALLLMGGVTVAAWLLFLCFRHQIFTVFGADEELLPLVMRYVRWVVGALPVFLASIFLATFVRNDGDPELAMKAVLIGGGVNIFGDWFLVFPMGMGISGAGLATLISNVLQTAILCTHFRSKKSQLHLKKPQRMGFRCRTICGIGFGAAMLDLANVVLFSLFNNQIMRYGGANYLALFGAVGTMSTLVQSLFSGVGQSIQPVISVNYGAGAHDRVKRVLRMAMMVALGLGICFTCLGLLLPQQIVKLFMSATPEVLALAPQAVRPYVLIYLFLGINVVVIYYLQSTLQPKLSNTVALLRGLVVSGALILLLPYLFGVAGVWWAMPVSELLVCIFGLGCLYAKRNRT
jgi:putative MATE family efflux protein